MTILSDSKIKKLSIEHNMISPFYNEQVTKNDNGEKVISYGLSSFGYDARLANQFKIFTNTEHSLIDPKNFSNKGFVEKEGDHCIIPPNSFVLACTIEKFKIPRNILALCIGKSTYARCGIIVNVTPVEPEFEGKIIIELSNTTPLPAKIYAGEGICQFIFYESEDMCNISYADKNGKYMSQEEITYPKL